MSGQFLDNFNFDPVDNKETTASYTVPAGKYAIMSVTLSVSASGNVFESGIVGGALDKQTTIQVTSTSDSTTIELKLKSGSVITKTELPASASDSTLGGESRWVNAVGTSTAAVLVDGVEVSQISCSAKAIGFDSSTTNNSDVTASVSGTSVVHWHIAEYNKQGA